VIDSDPLERQLIVAHCEGTGGNVDGDRETGTGLPSYEIASSEHLFTAPRAKLGAKSREVIPGFELNLYTSNLN